MMKSDINQAKTASSDKAKQDKSSTSSTTDKSSVQQSTTKTSEIEYSNDTITVSLGSVKGAPGDTVSVPVSFKGIPASGVTECSFTIEYDSKVLEPVQIASGDIVADNKGDFESNIVRENNNIILTFLDSTMKGQHIIKKDGLFANLKFRIKSDVANGSTDVKIKTADSLVANPDTKIIKATFENATININK